MSKPSVLIVGGGWAGLAAAAQLSRAGHPVELYEAAPQLGGRARSVELDGHVVDNGQHLLIGAYRDTIALLRQIGVDPESLFVRESLHLSVHREDSPLELEAPLLPAPLHLAWALLTAQGVTPAERRAALAFCLRVWRMGFRLKSDISVAELLADQPASLVRALWEPLCLATLNTHIHEASGQVFLRVLGDAFARRRRDSDLLHPRRDLGQVLPQPARRYIEQRGGRIHTSNRVEALVIENHELRGVMIDGKQHDAEHLILATAPWHAATLLAPHTPLQALARQITTLDSAPISTLYLTYPPGTRLDQPMLGFASTTVQWLIDRGQVCGQNGLMAAVISGDGPHMDLTADELAAKITTELAARLPHWPQPRSWRLIREKRATFRCKVGCEALRPGNATPLHNLWLAGDYTATGYPATLEGAVRSGLQCAHQIIRLHG